MSEQELREQIAKRIEILMLMKCDENPDGEFLIYKKTVKDCVDIVRGKI